MSDTSPALYATKRWNPTTGCSPVSAGCAHCWARRFAQRHRGRFGYQAADPFRPTCHPDRLEEPLHWRSPQTVAVSFMGDLFHEAIDAYFIGRVLGTALVAPHHRFLVLTKRPERLRDLARGLPLNAPNLWLGVSVEDQQTADERIPILIATPAVYRWVSIEPQIGRVSLDPAWLMGLDWVVQGCESGPRRRPFDIAWARNIRAECAAARVPYYLKQLPYTVAPNVWDDDQYLPCDGDCGGCDTAAVARMRLTTQDADERCPSWRWFARHPINRRPVLDGHAHRDVPWTMERNAPEEEAP